MPEFSTGPSNEAPSNGGFLFGETIMFNLREFQANENGRIMIISRIMGDGRKAVILTGLINGGSRRDHAMALIRAKKNLRRFTENK